MWKWTRLLSLRSECFYFRCVECFSRWIVWSSNTRFRDKFESIKREKLSFDDFDHDCLFKRFVIWDQSINFHVSSFKSSINLLAFLRVANVMILIVIVINLNVFLFKISLLIFSSCFEFWFIIFLLYRLSKSVSYSQILNYLSHKDRFYNQSQRN